MISDLARFVVIALIVTACAFGFASGAEAQVRGVYPLGMSATGSGITPEPGFIYVNQFLFYSRDKFKGPDGEVLASGNNSVWLDMNTFGWVSKKKIFGAKFSMTATLPIAKNSLTSDVTGPVNGASGFGDSYYQPFILGWDSKWVAVRAVYGFLAPTGRFRAGANDNVGSGYWTHALSSGQTFFLTKDKKTTLSTFQMYEFHTTQETTQIKPGQTFNLDYSLMHTLPIAERYRLQAGIVGYLSRQTTAKGGPGVTPDEAASRYKVNALGFGASMNVTNRINMGFKYFKEFENRSTFEGYSAQISGSIRF